MMNDVFKTIKERRSVRAYTSQQLRPEDLDLILEAGRYAPTAHNEQPWHFTVVQNKELLDEISRKAKEVMATSDNDWLRDTGKSPTFHVTYEAPTVIFVSAKKDAMAQETDCSAAIENMLLEAKSLGIGSVWVGLLWNYLQLEEAPVRLQLPEGYEPVYGVAFGYASGEALPAPERKTDVVNYNR